MLHTYVRGQILSDRFFRRGTSCQGNLRQSEVQDLGVSAVGDKNVGRLDVSVNDALAVRRVQRIGHLNPQTTQNIRRNRPAADTMFQCYALEKLHGDEASAALLADFVNGADVGVIQRGGGSRLAPKKFQGLRVLCQGLRQELQSHEPAQLHILRFINHAHAAAAELLYDAVMRNGLSDQRRRIRHSARILVFCCQPSQRRRRTIQASFRLFELGLSGLASETFVLTLRPRRAEKKNPRSGASRANNVTVFEDMQRRYSSST